MTIPKVSFTCDRFADKLSDYLERDLDEPTRASMDAHAMECAECGSLLTDLRSLRLGAANLPELVPSSDLWKGIAERIETPVILMRAEEAKDVILMRAQEAKDVILMRAQRAEDPLVRRRMRIWAGLAAAGLVAVTATVTHELTKRSIVATPPVAVATLTPSSPSAPAVTPNRDTVPAIRPAASAPAATLVSDRPSAQQTYDTEIARLRVVVARRRPQLDSTTIAVIEYNLKVIDDAIRQCKLALRKDPGSQFLMESLNDALDNKVQLLRTAATLPSKA
jgi:hypothetical protein